MPWGLLGPLGACLGLLGTLLGLPRDPLGSDPWIRSMVLFDLKRKIDFLMSFRGFAELSFFSCLRGSLFALFLFYVLKMCVFYVEKIDDWQLMTDD